VAHVLAEAAALDAAVRGFAGDGQVIDVRLLSEALVCESIAPRAWAAA